MHDFDIIRWVTGREVVEVYAVGGNRGADYIKEAGDADTCFVTRALDCKDYPHAGSPIGSRRMV